MTVTHRDRDRDRDASATRRGTEGVTLAAIVALIEELSHQLADIHALGADRERERERLLSVEELAERMGRGCTPKRIYNLKNEGRIPYLKDGGHLLFRWSDVLASLEQQAEQDAKRRTRRSRAE